jgi:dihydrolipoamide dehydrogenase
MEVVDGQVEYTIKHETGGVETISVERALISIGRIPNTDRLKIENAGVSLDKCGYVVHDNTQTSVKHIYAAGDITYDVALANVGEVEGRYAVEKMFGRVTEPLSYNNMSTIIFADPEIAAIGMNEQQAQAGKIPYRVAMYSYALINRAIAMRATDGYIKLLVTDDSAMKIIGMRCLGVHASTAIEVVSLMMKQGRSARDLAELIHPHPAMTEGLQECVRMLMGISVYKPSVFTTELRLSRVFYDEDGVKEEKG